MEVNYLLNCVNCLILHDADERLLDDLLNVIREVVEDYRDVTAREFQVEVIDVYLNVLEIYLEFTVYYTRICFGKDGEALYHSIAFTLLID